MESNSGLIWLKDCVRKQEKLLVGPYYVCDVKLLGQNALLPVKSYLSWIFRIRQPKRIPEGFPVAEFGDLSHLGDFISNIWHILNVIISIFLREVDLVWE